MKPNRSPVLEHFVPNRRRLVGGRRLLLVLLEVITMVTGQPVFAADCAALPAGVISWWRGEGNGGDATGHNDATLLNGVGFTSCEVGQGFSFDGVDDRVLVANTAALNFGPGGDFSIEAWIQPLPAVTDFGVQSIVDKRFTPDSAAAVGYAFALVDGKLACQLADAPLASLDFSTFLSPGPDLRDGQFHHVAMAVERTITNGGKLYVDGQVVLTFDPTVQPGDLSTIEPLRIGNHADPTLNSHFKGRIDELALYGRALSPNEVAAIYAAGSAGKCAPPRPPWLLAGPITNPANGHWYYLLDATNWPAAEQIGVSLGGHLATLNNAAENAWVVSTFSSFGGGDRALWIGLNDARQENIWQWISGAPATYLNWAPGEPNSGGGFFPDEDQVLILNPSSGFPLGSWNDAPSNQLHSAVVEVSAPEPVILAGPITNTANAHWYYLLNFTNWPAAEQIAVSLGGHLATINNAAENTWVFDTFSTFEGLERPMWIGLNDSTQEGAWAWTSGEPVSYLNWSPIEPNSGGGVFPDEDHALMWHPSSGYPLGSWNDAPSNQLQYAVVEVAPPAPLIVAEPLNQTTYVGSNVTFRVTATGGAPLAYQWRFYETNLPGKTISELTLPNVQLSNSGPYSVVVSNVSGVVTSSIAILTVNPLPDCVPPPVGLVSWWRAENDATDNWDANHGTVNGRGFVPGKVGRAFNSPAMSVPDAASLRVTNSITLEAWVNPFSSPGTTPQTIISKFDYPSTRQPIGTQSSYLLGTTNNGRLFFTVSATGSARTNTSLITTQALPINQWTFVVATYDGAALRIYLNGTLAAQTNYSGGIFPGTANLGLGAIPVDGQFGWSFNGRLDEPSLYNRALTDAEILAIYNADVVGKCLVAPSIVTQPEDQSVPLGEDVKFTVGVSGSRPLRYQWRFNGTNLVNATNSALVLEKVQTNRIGSYSVFVSNAVGTATSANAALTLTPAPTCTDSPSGLISWWPGDDNRFDAMGANNITTFSPTLYATGKVGRAFSLNGASSRIQVPNSASLNFGSNADFSIEMWIKAGVSNTLYPNVPLMEKLIGNPAITWVGYSLSLNQGRLAFAMASLPQSATNASKYISSGPDLRDGMFHHVAVSVNRTNPSGGNLFVDGKVVLNFNPTSRNGNLASGNSLYLGSPSEASSSSFLGGAIDEPAIYNRALTASEILAIHQAGAAGKCKVKPSILVQPVSQRVTIGSNVTASVTAVGTPRLRYQWLRNNQSISGATNSTYSFVFSSAEFGGTYACRVTNLFGAVMSSNAVLTLNRVPFARGQNVVLNEDIPTDLLISAFDQNLDPLTFIIVTPPQHGTLSPLTISPGDKAVFAYTTYTPTANYNGPDSFVFKVNDGLADSTNATVNLMIRPVNDPPVSQSQSVALDEDTTAVITLGAFDVDGDPITFSVGMATHGTLTGTPPNLTYRPATNYFGPDRFTFSVSDGQTNSELATVSLTVRPVNDAPVAEIVLAPLSQLPGVTNLLVIAPVGSNATVYLDGSRSTDLENDPLQYFWSEGTNALATGVLATNRFAPGRHVITLTVNDGQATGTNSVILEVLSPEQAVETLTKWVEDADLEGRNANPLLASLRAAAAAFDRGNLNAGINQLQAFQHKVQAQIAPLNPALAAALIATAQEIIDALTAPALPGLAGNPQPLPAQLRNGKFQLSFNGPHGRTYFIESSTNLLTWEIIGVARNAGHHRFDFEDVHATQFPGRFYRVAAP